jgi:hypothetical protein
MKVCESGVLRRLFGTERDEMAGKWRTEKGGASNIQRTVK